MDWSRSKSNDIENPDLRIDKVNKITNWLEYESLETQRELSLLDNNILIPEKVLNNPNIKPN